MSNSIEEILKKVEDEKLALQAEFHNWRKKEPLIDHPNYGLWMKKSLSLDKRMLILDKRFKKYSRCIS